jgi:iron complex outermembrane receptor protein
MTVRGVSTVRNGQPPVAFVVDGVTLPSANSITQDLFDIERIEILKGPQGALYGRNSIGGAINIITREPEPELAGTVQLEAANGSDYAIKGSVSGPIVEDKVLYRISGIYRDSDGLLHNATPGGTADSEETRAIRGRLLARPGETLTLDLRLQYFETTQGSAYYVPLGIAAPIGPAFPLNTVTGIIQGDKPGIGEVKSTDVAFKLDWETSIGTLTSITSYHELRETNDQEIDWTPSSFLEGLLLDDIEAVTQEIRFTSPDAGRLRWFVGAYYQSTDKVRGTNAYLNATAVTPATFGNFDPALKFLVPVADERLDQRWRSYATFGQVNYDVRDDLEFTLALRYDVFKPSERQTLFGTTGPKLDERFADLQPKVSLAYKWNERVMTYATVARGWRPGGFGLPNILGLTDYDEETLLNYEVGMKYATPDRRLTVNTAGYYIDYSQQQIFLLTSNAVGGPVQLLVNVDKSRIYGLDMEVIAKPFDRLELTAGVGLLHHELEAVGANTLAALATSLPPANLPRPGNKLPNTVSQTVNFSAQYTHPLSGDASVVGRLDYSRRGKTYWTLDNMDVEDPYDLVNLRLGLNYGDWNVTAFVENVFDKEYFSQVFTAEWSGFVTDVGWPSRPRRYGIQVSRDF